MVKTVKSETSLDLNCEYYGNMNSRAMLSGDSMLSQVKAVEQMLLMESSEHINDSLTNEDLKTAAEMFLYVNSCTYLLTPWLSFCKNLFENESPSTILLSLNRMLKVGDTRENRDLKTIVKKLFQKSNSLFSPKYGEVKGMSGTD